MSHQPQRRLQTDEPSQVDSGPIVRRAAIVGCGDDKHDGRLPAREKYSSTYFRLKREFAETLCDRWWILSAKYGLLSPAEPIDDYDVSITDDGLDVAAWTADVYSELSAVTWPDRTCDGSPITWELYSLAGSHYLDATDHAGRQLRDRIGDATPAHVMARFPFDDLAGIDYQQGWLATCRDTGTVIDPASSH